MASYDRGALPRRPICIRLEATSLLVGTLNGLLTVDSGSPSSLASPVRDQNQCFTLKDCHANVRTPRFAKAAAAESRHDVRASSPEAQVVPRFEGVVLKTERQVDEIPLIARASAVEPGGPDVDALGSMSTRTSVPRTEIPEQLAGDNDGIPQHKPDTDNRGGLNERQPGWRSGSSSDGVAPRAVVERSITAGSLDDRVQAGQAESLAPAIVGAELEIECSGRGVDESSGLCTSEARSPAPRFIDDGFTADDGGLNEMPSEQKQRTLSAREARTSGIQARSIALYAHSSSPSNLSPPPHPSNLLFPPVELMSQLARSPPSLPSPKALAPALAIADTVELGNTMDQVNGEDMREGHVLTLGTGTWFPTPALAFDEQAIESWGRGADARTSFSARGVSATANGLRAPDTRSPVPGFVNNGFTVRTGRLKEISGFSVKVFALVSTIIRTRSISHHRQPWGVDLMPYMAWAREGIGTAQWIR
ncbi:hypothetical protein B0H14DRAFT_3771718 [Mycena olivaceomarginata]|nr:hypothetical protein B0H14DRAFT_3771718 [Mycena olivaceomarginata]